VQCCVLDVTYGEGRLVDVAARAKAKAFTALRAASYFLLLVQENVTKEKDTPSRTARMKPARCPALLGARRAGFQSQEQEQEQPKQRKIEPIA